MFWRKSTVEKAALQAESHATATGERNGPRAVSVFPFVTHVRVKSVSFPQSCFSHNAAAKLGANVPSEEMKAKDIRNGESEIRATARTAFGLHAFRRRIQNALVSNHPRPKFFFLFFSVTKMHGYEFAFIAFASTKSPQACDRQEQEERKAFIYDYHSCRIFLAYRCTVARLGHFYYCNVFL